MGFIVYPMMLLCVSPSCIYHSEALNHEGNFWGNVTRSVCGKLVYWLLAIQNYDWTMEKLTLQNGTAPSLSRSWTVTLSLHLYSGLFRPSTVPIHPT